jgi:hypothetical protein
MESVIVLEDITLPEVRKISSTDQVYESENNFPGVVALDK